MNIASFNAFKGRKFDEVRDQIELAAHAQHHSVNVLDPANGMSSNIDVEPDRLNVTIDANFRIVKFTVG